MVRGREPYAHDRLPPEGEGDGYRMQMPSPRHSGSQDEAVPPPLDPAKGSEKEPNGGLQPLARERHLIAGGCGGRRRPAPATEKRRDRDRAGPTHDAVMDREERR